MFSDVHTIVFKTESMNTTGHTSAILWLLDIFTTNKDNQQSLEFFFFAITSKTFWFQPLREDLIEKKSPAVIGTELSTTFPRT